MSRRLTVGQKARLQEFISTDKAAIEQAQRVIDPNDSAEFHEGMAAGLLTALQLLQWTGERSEAYVRLHIFLLTAIADVNLIEEMIGGLNASVQVDDVSLENAKGIFEPIKELVGECPISYFDGDQGIDIVQVLHLLKLFDLNEWDTHKHPNSLYGNRQLVLEKYKKEIEKRSSGFSILIPKVVEILTLSEKLQVALYPFLEKLIRKPPSRRGYFIDESVPECPLSILYPVMAAFRAAVDDVAWREGRFEWRIDPFEILPNCVADFGEVIAFVCRDRVRIGTIGRKESVYRDCYATVMIELLTEVCR